MSTRSDIGQTRIAGLSALVAAASGRGEAPVELWNPPDCGDIGLAIFADGSWSYSGSPIARPAMVKLFARVLRRDADGRHYLVTPAEKVAIAVADAPFIAVEMQVDGSGASQTLTLRTNVDDVVSVGSAHPLQFELDALGGLKPYVTVRGRLRARMARPLVYDLVALAQRGECGDLGVWSGGSFWPFSAPHEKP